MFNVIAIGNIGGDAEVRNEGGNEFVSFRVAHNDKYTDSDGVVHTSTQWIDCSMNGRPNVLPWLKAGQMVMVMGTASLRIYDSAKDHCKKAGIRVNVRTLELLGAGGDKVPSRLYDDDGAEHPVQKYFHTDVAATVLKSNRGEDFGVDDNGWCVPFADLPEDVRKKITKKSKK